MDQWRPVTRLLCLAPATHFETIGGGSGGRIERNSHVWVGGSNHAVWDGGIVSASPFCEHPDDQLSFLALAILAIILFLQIKSQNVALRG